MLECTGQCTLALHWPWPSKHITTLHGRQSHQDLVVTWVPGWRSVCILHIKYHMTEGAGYGEVVKYWRNTGICVCVHSSILNVLCLRLQLFSQWNNLRQLYIAGMPSVWEKSKLLRQLWRRQKLPEARPRNKTWNSGDPLSFIFIVHSSLVNIKGTSGSSF